MSSKAVIIVVVIVVLGGLFLFMGRSAAPTEIELEENSMPVQTEEEVSERVVELSVEGSPFKFVPNTLRVKKGDTVHITFKNISGMHDFRIDEFAVATEVLQTGESETVEFVAGKTGTFEYYCSVGTHRAQGMVGTLVVE